MANETIESLGAIIKDLHAQRQAHESAIAEIDQAFQDLGIGYGAGAAPATRGPGAKKGRVGRPAKAKVAGARKTKKRHRGKFAVTGLDSILGFVREGGKSGRTGAEIDAHWQREGRKGSAYNLLGQLVREGKIKRDNIKGQRGSVYRAA